MRIELCLSFMISGVLLVWYMWLGGQHSVDELLQQNRSPIYGTLASIFGTLLGFIITVTSIVVGFAGSSQLRVVRESQHYSTIWAVFASATRALGLATVLALLALIFDRDTKPIPLLMFALVFAATLSLFRVLRAVWILENVIEIISKPKQ